MKSLSIEADKLFADIFVTLFNAPAPAPLLVDRIKGDSGELLLRLEGAPTAFGLINVGDAAGLAKHLETSFERVDAVTVRDSEFADPQFAAVRRDSSPINMLIGSKKFVEGWDCWRVSSMGLMNTGKREGSQIIQLFGRGVRLRGKDMSLQRTSQYKKVTPPHYIELLETLNVFGVGADFMEDFRQYLADEGLPGNNTPHIETVRMHKFAPALGDELKILRPKHRKDVKRAYAFKLDGPYISLVDASAAVPKQLQQRRILIDRVPRLSTLIAPDAAEHTAGAAPVRLRHFDAARLSFIDTQQLYLALERYCRERGYANLLLSQNALADLLELGDWYDIRIPDALWALSMQNLRTWESVALETLSRLCDWLFNHHARGYLEPRMELIPINDYAENIPDESDYQIRVNQTESKFITDIQSLKQAFDVDRRESYASPIGAVNGQRFDIHLFNPLLQAADDRITVSPVSLNASEYDFVTDLKAWLENNKTRFENGSERLHLLRNRVFRGVGFFEAGGFWPDFILWHIAADGAQTIVFVDPHGLMMGQGPGSEKVQFFRGIKDIERRVNAGDESPSIRLESAIVTPSNAAHIKQQWMASGDSLDTDHIYFMSEIPDYIDKLISLASYVPSAVGS